MATLPFEQTDPTLERELFSLVSRERFARDLGEWDQLDAMYWEDSVVRVTWFVGTSHEFVEMSRERAKGGSGMHTIDPVWVRVSEDGKRALVESRGQILIRPRIDGVQVDVTSWCRFFSRAELRNGEWKLRTFDSIYVKDRVDPVDPAASLALDESVLSAGRESYKHLRYLNLQAGYTVPDDLPGVDSPASVESFYAEAEGWLRAGD